MKNTVVPGFILVFGAAACVATNAAVLDPTIKLAGAQRKGKALAIYIPADSSSSATICRQKVAERR